MMVPEISVASILDSSLATTIGCLSNVVSAMLRLSSSNSAGVSAVKLIRRLSFFFDSLRLSCDGP